MSDNKLDKMIARVKALLAMSEGNASENEAKAMRAAADRLIQEYRIDAAMLEASGNIAPEAMVNVVVSEGGRRTAWREVLLHCLTKHYGCIWYLSSYRAGGEAHTKGRRGSKGVQKYTVVGSESDVKIVSYMFAYLERECERLCRWHTGGQGVGAAVAFLMGCAEGIHKQFRDLAAAARAQAEVREGGSTALAVLDKRAQGAEEYAKAHLGVSFGKAHAIMGGQDYASRTLGYKEGQKVQIRQGLGEGGSPTAKLGA